MNPKSITRVLPALLAALVLGTAAQAHAAGPRRDAQGYWDANHHHHPYATYHGHRGYWNQHGGTRVWINVD